MLTDQTKTDIYLLFAVIGYRLENLTRAMTNTDGRRDVAKAQACISVNDDDDDDHHHHDHDHHDHHHHQMFSSN